MTDSENSTEPNEEQYEEPRGFGLSTGLLWRIIAVGLFVALGTFAVIQSLNSGKDAHDHAGHDHAGVEASANEDSTVPTFNSGMAANTSSSSVGLDGTTPAADTTNTQTLDAGFSHGLSRLAKVSANHVQRKSPAPITRAGFETSTRTTPAPKSLRRDLAAKPKFDPAFSAKPRTNPIVAAKPPTQDNFKANLATRPPIRLAQLGNGPGGVATGFQGNPATRPPARPMTTSPFTKAATQAKEGLSGLKSGVMQKSTDLLNSAKQSVSNGATAVQDGATRLGNSMRPIEAKVPTNKASTSNPYSLSKQGTQNATSPSTSSPFKTSNTTAGTTMRPISRAGTGSNSQTNSTASPFSSRLPVGGSNLATQQAQPRQPMRRNNVPAELPRTQTNPSRTPFGVTARPRNGAGTRTNEPPTNPLMRQASTSRGAPVASIAARNTPGDRAFEGVQAPALTVEKVSPREIQVMQTADFEIIVKNVGRVVADEVRVLDKVPAGTQYISATPEPSSLNRSGDLQWSLGTMRPGQEKRVRYQLKPTQPGEIGSVAQVVFATRAAMRTTVTKPVLEIRHTTEPRVMIGDNVVFDVVVENKGDGPANQVIIQEKVPGNLEFSDGSPEIEYEIGTLMPGQSRRIQLGLRAAKVGKLRNVMFASAKGGLKAQHELDIEVVAPDLRTKSDGPTRRFIQRQATHRFTIENGGTAKAKNVELFARLPSGLRFVSANNRGKYDSASHSVVWVMPELSQGVAGTVELTTMPVEAGEQNIKFESFADLGLKSETKQQLTVEHLIDVFFDIDDVVDPIEIGAGTSYKIRVVNQGTKTASNVELLVDFPPGLQPTDVDGNLRNEIRGQRVIFEPISTMRPGDELGVTVRAVGKAQGDHRVVVNMQTDGRDTPVSKQETTRVYSDR